MKRVSHLYRTTQANLNQLIGPQPAPIRTFLTKFAFSNNVQINKRFTVRAGNFHHLLLCKKACTKNLSLHPLQEGHLVGYHLFKCLIQTNSNHNLILWLNGMRRKTKSMKMMMNKKSRRMRKKSLAQPSRVV